MAKAALNMMTRTCAADLAKSYVFMTAVDTGWINDEKPTGRAVEHARRHAFQTPLDEIDAAARILDPVLGGHEPPLHGVFLKDYAPVRVVSKGVCVLCVSFVLGFFIIFFFARRRSCRAVTHVARASTYLKRVATPSARATARKRSQKTRTKQSRVSPREPRET